MKTTLFISHSKTSPNSDPSSTGKHGFFAYIFFLVFPIKSCCFFLHNYIHIKWLLLFVSIIFVCVEKSAKYARNRCTRKKKYFTEAECILKRFRVINLWVRCPVGRQRALTVALNRCRVTSCYTILIITDFLITPWP